MTQTFIGDKLGRVQFMQLMCVIVTIGTVIQTGSVNIGMFLAGRILAGFAVGYIDPNPGSQCKEDRLTVYAPEA